MNALTYEMRSAAAAVTAAPRNTATKTIWARLWDALIEARMRQAEREIRMHIHLVPADVLRESGFFANYRNAEKLPFVK
jgi:uncharacterized membrane protein